MELHQQNLALHDKSLKIFDNIISDKALRENDICLMAATNTHPKLSTPNLQSFNQTIIYLKVKYLSELCNENGTHIKEEYWNCTATPTSKLFGPSNHHH